MRFHLTHLCWTLFIASNKPSQVGRTLWPAVDHLGFVLLCEGWQMKCHLSDLYPVSVCQMGKNGMHYEIVEHQIPCRLETNWSWHRHVHVHYDTVDAIVTQSTVHLLARNIPWSSGWLIRYIFNQFINLHLKNRFTQKNPVQLRSVRRVIDLGFHRFRCYIDYMCMLELCHDVINLLWWVRLNHGVRLGFLLTFFARHTHHQDTGVRCVEIPMLWKHPRCFCA